MAEPRILGIVLAGGEGKRLAPLTADRAKPAVPFGGLYRLIDFALSNLVNAGVLRITVLTQYKSHSLDRHITTTWRLSNLLGNYVTPVPGAAAPRPALVHRLRRRDLPVAQPHLRRAPGHRRRLRRGPRLPDGPAADDRPAHRRRRRRDRGGHPGAARARRPRSASSRPPTTAADRGVPGEAGQPARAARPPDETYASMGNYVFSTDALLDALHTDAAERGQQARHGRRHRPHAHRRRARRRSTTSSERGARRDRRAERYWRDVGTIDSYFEAHMDLCATVPASTSTTTAGRS